MYARQVRRAHLAAEWLDALGLQPGDQVADIGCGPGHVSLLAAARVGPSGRVYALDRSPEALALLERLQEKQGVPQIIRLAVDAHQMQPLPESVRAVLLTMILHHDSEPAGLLRRVGSCVPRGARVVVAEYHPDGSAEHGPPGEHRISPDQVQAWCEAAGFAVVQYRRQTPDHYMFILTRSSGD